MEKSFFQKAFRMNKKYIILLVLLLIAVFYWLEIRPANIRTECLISVKKESTMIYSFEDEPDVDKRGRLQDRYVDQYYKDCLHEKGLAE